MPVYGDQINAFGKSKRLAEWSRESGIPFHVLSDRIRRRHWEPERALTQPVRNHNRMVTIDNVSMPLYKWTERTGINYKTAQSRLNNGWDPKEAMSAPLMVERAEDGIRHSSKPQTGYRPRYCTYPDCDRCPYSDCVCP